MKSIFKRIISMVMVFTLVFAISATAFAASGFHKVNGVGREHGGDASYTSTTTAKCSRITAQGTSDNNNSLHVFITIKGNIYGNVVDRQEIILNGNENKVISFSSKALPADTYTVKIEPKRGYTSIGYEVSTFFYE